MTGVPLVDLGAPDAPAVLDAAFRDVGFVMVTDHDVPAGLVDRTRDAFLRFFHLPADRKAAVRMPRLGMAGWAPMGMEANGYSFGHETPPDMKESYRLGAHELPGRVALRGANVWPEEPAGFRAAALEYLAAVDAVHLRILELCATALGLDDPGFFRRHALRNDNTLNVNWYAPITHLGAPADGQYRIGPHTDFGTITVLSREPRSSALQVQLPDGAWVDAPVVDGAFTVNCGDMMAHWSGGRWRSAIHRVLAPSAAEPDDALLSLVYFCEPDPETMITPLGECGGETVNAGEYLAAKIAAISM
ncbi:MAG: hypothetical protein M9961_08390 [Ilumatobacteraceae bacterium]|nr:hypothetical protein [Ilumatobacteraceae bacterium]